MQLNSFKKFALCATASASMLFAAAAQAAPTLDPLFLGAAPSGNSQGLKGDWYKIDDQARFSNQMWSEAGAPATEIKNFSWGTGIWSAADIATITAPNSPYVTAHTTSQGAINYANTRYNAEYGTSPWGPDGVRPLAPIIGVAGGGEENYAAVFSGYIYIAKARSNHFGVFSDDGFAFSLEGATGSLDVGRNSVTDVTGREWFSLADANGLTDNLMLDVGYYGINLSYFNRMEAGVINLGWSGPDGVWSDVPGDALVPNDPTNVPEPASIALVGLGLAAVAAKRRKAKQTLDSSAV